jgi:hypothetical protein
MTITWQYPLYLIPLDGGYVSVVGMPADQAAAHHLAVFTTVGLAEAFMQRCQIPGTPRALRNAREFGWLLQSLRHPVTRVAFDPQPDTTTVCSRWNVAVEELLACHLVPDHSPWNYPVFVVCRQQGYASIEGLSPDGSRWTAIGLFTAREKAEAYLQASLLAGTIRELNDVRQARALLREIADSATAVALDPTINAGRHAATHCFSLRTVLEKYLNDRASCGNIADSP